MLRSFTTTTSSQVIREKVRGVQNFKILVGTTGRRAAVRRPRTAGMPPAHCRTAAVRRPRAAIAGRVCRPACLNSRRSAA